jgi:tRNA(Ile2) C34 agmatinyltransferase TiaS
MSKNINRHGEPRCPVCGHFLNSDSAEGWICDKRGGCGSEFGVDEFDAKGEPRNGPTH